MAFLRPNPFNTTVSRLAAYQQEATKPLVLALLGPTATGKTDLALACKHSFDQAVQAPLVRLINIDSVQCYRELEIGTAKPCAAQRGLFALMDFLEPDCSYSVASYVTQAEKEISAALAQGQLPLLVGGSMMYYKALENGLAPLPQSDAGIRQDLQQELNAKGYASMLCRLKQVDPLLAARLYNNDTQRLIRGLEVYRITGQPLSSLQQRGRQGAAPAYRLLPVCINPDKRWVNTQIAARLRTMLQAGLVSEVVDLQKKFSRALDMPAFRSVGYRQVLEMLNDEFDEEKLFDRILFATRQLAKRQRTWLNQWPQAEHIESTKKNDRLQQLVTFLATTGGTIRT